jgi:hypothetical protein
MIPLNRKPEPQNFNFSYNFDSEETAKLAKFFRENQERLPNGLEKFSKALEDAVYHGLSLEQARKFFT